MMRSPRKATVRNMARAVLIHQRIQTTLRRAKETRRLVDRLITMAKSDTVAAHRLVYAILTDRDMVAKLFKDIAPLFKNRAGGYTRIIQLGFRRGDGAQMAILELTERKIEEKIVRKKKEKAKKEEAQAGEGDREAKKGAEHAAKSAKGAAAKAEAAGAAGAAKHEAAGEAKPNAAHHEEPKQKAISKSKPTLEEEKRTEKARAESDKLGGKKGFVKNLRGFFRRKSDM